MQLLSVLDFAVMALSIIVMKLDSVAKDLITIPRVLSSVVRGLFTSLISSNSF